MEYRKEIKYIINNYEFNLVNENLNMLLNKDKYCKDKYYTITSIYFDDYNNTSYEQVKFGISKRWKYRIRFYNYDDSYIKLEKKYKENNLTKKIDTQITKEVVNEILNNKIKVSNNNNTLLNELIVKMNTEYLRPSICIEYDRIPYVYKIGNVRITLDFNIRYNDKFNNLFDKEKRMYSIENKILEVKYNELLPDFISKKLGLNNLISTSFSKFMASMDALKGGNINDTWNK